MKIDIGERLFWLVVIGYAVYLMTQVVEYAYFGSYAVDCVEYDSGTE